MIEPARAEPAPYRGPADERAGRVAPAGARPARPAARAEAARPRAGADGAAAPAALLPLEEACARAAAACRPVTEAETVALALASGRVLAEPVRAARACPPSDRSAMDGYAVAAGQGLAAGTVLRVRGRIAAGEAGEALAPGIAARIFTGAPLPPGADAVVMQEHATVSGDALRLGGTVAPGDHVRRRGEDVMPGDGLAAAGTRLDPRRIALLAAQGIGTVRVRRRLRVAVLSTGNELRGPGEDGREDSGTFDTNRPMLIALLGGMGLEVVDGGRVRDEPAALARALRDLAARADLVVTTGGASVGEEDHAAGSLRLAGGTGETLALDLKPGKPAVVGRIGAAACLGLPGNPVSALVSFSLLGRAMLARLEGRDFARPQGLPLPLAHAFRRKPGRTEFMPARLVPGPQGPALALLGSTSARLAPLVEADGFVEVPASLASGAPGEPVAFHPFGGLLGA
ncbi:molybdenum cofactor synthesis domain protein [Methylobacterium sp. 4-46]|uniref:molybdopterin molybdotransferase MoeA n=1 Tax=unclassified Methylobacterium TaxID=2615210 RepID=UPI000152CEC8|nr:MULTISPECIES: gephyrin-like molybdotransferase Glp [Methylobacterium]ACA17830.1 molybdenum cofactor synthesis domain protein [Methylobacterium sp. 4-46]WFT77137.1 molybdopterin molybdotransferase MoeA [Methylobacterium nodulans]